MQPSVLVTLSGALTFGVPLVLAIRELLANRRGDGPGPDGNAPATGFLPPTPGVDVGSRPLPSCLIPVLHPSGAPSSAQKARELEPV